MGKIVVIIGCVPLLIGVLNMVKLEYRPSVLAVITDGCGLFLVGERRGIRGAWQFPQGGVDRGEKPLAALYRELGEEIGCNDIRVLKESATEITYDFPPGLNSKLAQKYRGQTQRWYLCQFNDGAAPDPGKSDAEFMQFKWLPLDKILASVIEWKLDAYKKGLSSLGLI